MTTDVREIYDSQLVTACAGKTAGSDNATGSVISSNPKARVNSGISSNDMPLPTKLQKTSETLAKRNEANSGEYSKDRDTSNSHYNKSPAEKNFSMADSMDTGAGRMNMGGESQIYSCTSVAGCVTLKNILESFKAPLSEEQAWALIYQYISMYQRVANIDVQHIFNELEIPDTIDNIGLHRDGTVRCIWKEAEHKDKLEKLREKEFQSGVDKHALILASHKKILRKIGVIVYTALDYNLHDDEQCQMSQELESLITYMTADEAEDDCIDEGIDEGYKRWDDDNNDNKYVETKEFDFIIQTCQNHIKPTPPSEHYKAVCRALVAETIELGIFLQQVLNNGEETLHLKAESQDSQRELAKLGFLDWARFWVQVIDELRRGVRLKKANYERTPIEYELTPYEILMEDIRSRKYQLRKVMVNGDIPPRVKKDAHALILEFIRSRPPLKKASERKLPQPIKRTPSPREQLMDSIRKGRILKHIQPPIQPRLKDRLLSTSAVVSATLGKSNIPQSEQQFNNQYTKQDDQLLSNDVDHNTNNTRSKQRLIKVDFSLLQDDDNLFETSNAAYTASTTSTKPMQSTANFSLCSQLKMPPYPISGYLVNDSQPTANTQSSTSQIENLSNCTTTSTITVRNTRKTNDKLENSQASLSRRHTIVGCQSNFHEVQSLPTPLNTCQTEFATSDITYNSNCNQVITAKPQEEQYQLEKHLNESIKHNNINDNCNQKTECSNGPWNKSFMDKSTWNERVDDRLSLTLEEIVHIRSVITKAELESLPVGIQIKEDVERRKICFLCLRTRFSIFGPWGIQCKICQRTVCSKCYTKLRIPSEHFRNVPLVLISPSLLASPACSSIPSPSYQGHYMRSSTGNILDEEFPKSLLERLRNTSTERRASNAINSPSSLPPTFQRSNMSTPGVITADIETTAGQAIEAIYHNAEEINANSGIFQRNPYNSKHHNNVMSCSLEGPRSLPLHSPFFKSRSNSNTLDRRSIKISSSSSQLNRDREDNKRGVLVSVCNDCKGLVMEISQSIKQKRSSARNRALKNLTLDLSPVWK